MLPFVFPRNRRTWFEYLDRKRDKRRLNDGDSPVTPVEDPDRIMGAAVHNNVMSNVYTTSSTETKCAIFVPYRIGAGDRKNLALAFNGWRMSSGGSIINFGYTIDECYFQANGVIKRVTFDGGSTAAKVVASGANDVRSDLLLPSDFGLTVFPQNSASITSPVYAKFIITVAASSGVGVCDSRSNSIWTSVNAQHWFYNPSVTTISNKTGTGPYTRTGTAANNRDSGLCPILLGAFAPGKRKPVFMTVGSSTGAGVNDSKSYTAGSGMFARAMYDITQNIVRAHMHFAGSGASLTQQSDSKMIYWQKFADVLLDQSGANSVGAYTVSQMQTMIGQLWTAARTNAVKKICRVYFSPQTDSTDAWATTANQTYVTRWGPGENTDQLNIWAAGRKTAAVIDEVFPVNSFRDGTLPLKWKVNGVASYPTNDGQHGSSALHTLGVAEISPILAALEASITTYPPVSV